VPRTSHSPDVAVDSYRELLYEGRVQKLASMERLLLGIRHGELELGPSVLGEVDPQPLREDRFGKFEGGLGNLLAKLTRSQALNSHVNGQVVPDCLWEFAGPSGFRPLQGATDRRRPDVLVGLQEMALYELIRSSKFGQLRKVEKGSFRSDALEGSRKGSQRPLVENGEPATSPHETAQVEARDMAMPSILGWL